MEETASSRGQLPAVVVYPNALYLDDISRSTTVATPLRPLHHPGAFITLVSPFTTSSYNPSPPARHHGDGVSSNLRIEHVSASDLSPADILGSESLYRVFSRHAKVSHNRHAVTCAMPLGIRESTDAHCSGNITRFITESTAIR